DYLEQILPDWTDKNNVKIEIIKPDGNAAELILPIPEKIKSPLKTSETKFELPSVDRKSFVYNFTGQNKKTAILRIDNMYTYRESFEYDESAGHERRRNLARDLYRKYNGKSAPYDFNETLAGIPSATEVFTELVIDMKTNKTENLIIDLRKNRGGYSFMSDILLYFLYGKEKYLSIKKDVSSYEIKKYSDLFFSNKSNMSIDNINQGRTLPLKADDYDFRYDYSENRPYSSETGVFNMDSYFQNTPTFYREYSSEKHSGYYKPDNIVVICSPETYSSGFGMMYAQHKAGALVAGRASSQAGNGFGDILHFELKYSKLKGTISQDYIVHFPEDPVQGKVLQPDHELTYGKLKSYNFDPNAEILFALEVLKIR
ncbi:S41 family peptidase, partial [candidate division KSB1 bacterium]